MGPPKNRIRKKFRILTQNGLPTGPSKSQKSHKIRKMGASNAFRELLRPLSVQKRFSSRLLTPPEPQNWRFYYGKTTVFRNPLYPQNCLFWTPFGSLLASCACLGDSKRRKLTNFRGSGFRVIFLTLFGDILGGLGSPET